MIKIIDFKEQHFNEGASIFHDTFNACGEKWTVQTCQDYIKENYNPTFALAAVDGDTLLGFLMGLPITTQDKKWLYIDTIVVKQEKQQIGVGQLLWEKAILKAKEANLSGIRLLANPNFLSYSWYEKLGLKQTGWVELFNTFTN